MKTLFNHCCSRTKHAFSGYFTQLLVSLVLLFVFRPYDRGHLYVAIWEILFVIVFLSAIFNCNHSKTVKIVATCFAIPALICHWIHMFMPILFFAAAFLILAVIFIFITTSSIIKRVVLNARVRMDMLRGVVCAYFMIAFGFAFLLYLINILVPDSFHFALANPDTFSHSRYLSEMMYYSFVTLLCIGFGDITAKKDVAQTFTILEGIVGQFYIAILVARLVSVYSFFEHKLHLTTKDNKDQNGS